VQPYPPGTSGGDVRDYESSPGARSEIHRLLAELRTSADPDTGFGWSRLAEFSYPASIVDEIADAARASGATAIHLLGRVWGPVEMDAPCSVVVAGTVDGDLRVRSEGDVAVTGQVEGRLTVSHGRRVTIAAGARTGDLTISGEVLEVSIGGTVDGSFSVFLGGEVTLNITVVSGGRVTKDLRVEDGTTVEGTVSVSERGTVDGTLSVATASRVSVVGTVGDLMVPALGGIGGSCAVTGGTVRGNIAVIGDVGDRVEISRSATVVGTLSLFGRVRALEISGATVTKGVLIDGAVEGDLAIDDLSTTGPVEIRGTSIDGDLIVAATTPSVALKTTTRGAVILTPTAPRGQRVVPLTSVSHSHFEREVQVGGDLSIVDCDLRSCADIDQLHLVGPKVLVDADGKAARSLTRRPAQAAEDIPHGEMAVIYRQLRVNFEKRSNRPAAATFYRGEMDARRDDARSSARTAEWAWLTLYRRVSGYGLSAWRPAAWFLALVVAATLLLKAGRLVIVAPEGGRHLANWGEALGFSLQSTLSLFRSPEPIGLGVLVVQVALRLLGPILIALAALAIRDRVAR
jgi:hypothetical protein